MLSDKNLYSARNGANKGFLVIGLLAAMTLSACQFQPLYAPSPDINGNSSTLMPQVSVDAIETRVGQQVRNHLLFLLNGGNDTGEPAFTARLQVSSFERRAVSHTALSDTTAGFVTITASYTLVDASNQKRVSSGSRKATAYFDRSSQIFANQRAVRDAENRAGKEVAEKLRFAFASDLRK